MEYKKLYDPGEVAELLAWFRQRLDRLPESIRIEEGLYVPDLRRTVPLLIEFAEVCSENPTYSAQLRRFFEIRERLIEQGFDCPPPPATATAPRPARAKKAGSPCP